jgi:hypothetical protein
MKKQIVLLALGAMTLGCSSDSIGPANSNPDAASCGKGSISAGDVKTGQITESSCVRYDFAYTQDSVPFDSYSFKADKGKGYMFLLENADLTQSWDALLELVTVNPNTGEEQLLSISDDEGGAGYSRMYFIAPVSGTFYIRAAGYSLSDLSSYKLTARSCDSPIPQIAGTLDASTQTLSASDCVIAHPFFADDSSHVKLFSLQIGPNETKTITVSSDAFQPGFQVWGPAWGVSCDYAYEGCGGGYASIGKGSTVSYTITAEGDFSCNGAFQAPEHVGPLASMQLASPGFCSSSNFPGQYTVAVGSNSTASGDFTISVSEGAPPLSLVGGEAKSKNPTLNFLRRKPMRGGEYLSRSM